MDSIYFFPSVKSRTSFSLSPFDLLQVVKANEKCSAFSRAEPKGAVLKIMKGPYLHGWGGQFFWERPLDLFPCKGDRLVAHGPANLAEEGMELRRIASPSRCPAQAGRASPSGPAFKFVSLLEEKEIMKAKGGRRVQEP